MKEYLEQILHREVSLEEYTVAKLPPVWRSSVRLFTLQLGGQECLLIVPEENLPLPRLRGCYHQITRITGRQCALYLRSLTYYAKDALLQEGIPFVWEGRQLYLPFLGMLLNPQDDRRLKPCEQISFVTQKLLLKALYESW